MAIMRRITEINGEIIMVETMIIVVDSYGKIVRSFRSWSEANKFRIVMNRLDWRIVP